MNVKARINARKVVLNFFYEILFMEYASNKNIIINDILKEDKAITYVSSSEDDKQNIIKLVKNYYNIENYHEELDYLIENFFKKEKEEGIDMDYVFKVSSYLKEYLEIVQKLVDENSTTFKFCEMDLIDRVIFLIGIIEIEIIKTPKKVVLNEMIELAKRYGDGGSFKLINGIGHKILPEND